MRTYIVSRHPGALRWLSSLGHDTSEVIAHMDEVQLKPGDLVIGTLPVHHVAEVNRQGARYLHICMQLPAWARGRELDVAEMTAFKAQLQEFRVEHKND